VERLDRVSQGQPHRVLVLGRGLSPGLWEVEDHQGNLGLIIPIILPQFFNNNNNTTTNNSGSFGVVLQCYLDTRSPHLKFKWEEAAAVEVATAAVVVVVTKWIGSVFNAMT
jgi:hypothetical protein